MGAFHNPARLSIALVSGGMDSCLAAAIACRNGPCAFLHVTYGQRTARREHKAFLDLAAFFEVPENLRLVVNLESLSMIGGSALTDPSISVPKFHEVPADEGGEKPATYVPFRNAHIIATAVSWAEVIGAGSISIGAVAEDSAGYPDCRPDFYTAFNRLIAVGSYAGESLRVETPVIAMTKSEIVKMGLELNAPFHLTWSCYEREDAAGGQCDSCLRRLRAFRQAGIKDPIPYVS